MTSSRSSSARSSRTPSSMASSKNSTPAKKSPVSSPRGASSAPSSKNSTPTKKSPASSPRSASSALSSKNSTPAKKSPASSPRGASSAPSSKNSTPTRKSPVSSAAPTPVKEAPVVKKSPIAAPPPPARQVSPKQPTTPRGNKKDTTSKAPSGSAPQSASMEPRTTGALMVSSQQQQQDITAAKKTIADPVASKRKLAGDELQLFKSLRDVNATLMMRLKELNAGLDQQLTKQQRGGKASTHNASPDKRFQYTADDSPPPLTKSDRLAARNLEMRRELTSLHRALKEQQAGTGALFDLRNKAGALKKLLEEVHGENKSLENVYGNQNVKTSKFDKGEQQLNEIRREHNDQVRETKELAKQFKDLREIEMSRTRNLLKYESHLQEKAKFLAQHGFGLAKRKPNGTKPLATPTKSKAGKREKDEKSKKKEKKSARSPSKDSAKSSASSRSSSTSSSSSQRSSASSHKSTSARGESIITVDTNNTSTDGEPTLTKNLVLKCFPYLAEDAECVSAPFNPKVLHAYLSRLVLEEETLQEKIQHTAVQAVRDRHRTRTQGPKLQQEMDDLKGELKLLREKEEAFNMVKSINNM